RCVCQSENRGGVDGHRRSNRRPRSAQMTSPSATHPRTAKAVAIGRIVPSNDWSITAPMRAPPAVETVPMTAEAVPATGRIGYMAIVLKFGMRREWHEIGRASGRGRGEKRGGCGGAQEQ